MPAINTSPENTINLEVILLMLLNRKFPTISGTLELLSVAKNSYWRRLFDLNPHEARAFNEWTASKKKEMAIAYLNVARELVTRTHAVLSSPPQSAIDQLRADLLCYMVMAGDIPQNYHLEEQDEGSLRDHLLNYTERDDLSFVNDMMNLARRNVGLTMFSVLDSNLYTATKFVEELLFQ
jgi:hypothetical protein